MVVNHRLVHGKVSVELDVCERIRLEVWFVKERRHRRQRSWKTFRRRGTLRVVEAASLNAFQLRSADAASIYTRYLVQRQLKASEPPG